MNECRVKLQENGRIIIPANYRKQLHFEPGEELVLRIEENGLHLYSLKQSLRKAQSVVQHYAKNKSLVAELQRMRKEDAEHD
ncbi:MAG: AbrB/MazE/SpoVT family DNA-binding domain-containing protein [Legionellales bacterium]|nr:AbrB/MazE/SpoVT family DNA-binding domain-containing protein [Legionellales bacterium]